MTTKTYYSPASFANLIGAQHLTSSVLTIDPEPALIRVSTTYTKTSVSSQGSAELQVSPDGTDYYQFGDTFFTNVGETNSFDFDAIVSGITKVRMVYQEIGNTGSAGTISAGAMVANDATIEELQILSSRVYTSPGDMVFADANGNPQVLHLGDEEQIMQIVGGTPTWQTIVTGSGGAGTPADVLLDVSSPDTFVALNNSGVGQSLTVAQTNDLLKGHIEFDFSSSTGWTLTNGLGGATITGGVARLTMPTGVISSDLGRASIVRDLTANVNPTKFVAKCRLVAITNGDSNTQVGFHISTSGATTNELRTAILPSGSVVVGYLGSGWTTLATSASSITWDGTWWLEITIHGATQALIRFGQGTTSAPPDDSSSSWRIVWTGNLYSYMQYSRPFDNIGCYLTTFDSGGGDITVDMDNVILESV